jgi:hypothetical protein
MDFLQLLEHLAEMADNPPIQMIEGKDHHLLLVYYPWEKGNILVEQVGQHLEISVRSGQHIQRIVQMPLPSHIDEMKIHAVRRGKQLSVYFPKVPAVKIEEID